jgi:hypothetical protein
VTRSHKLNDQDHSVVSDDPSIAHESVPRYFGKTGPFNADPYKTKKDGGGKGNWLADHNVFCVVSILTFIDHQGPLWR